jgi:hypothetical protein
VIIECPRCERKFIYEGIVSLVEHVREHRETLLTKIIAENWQEEANEISAEEFFIELNCASSELLAELGKQQNMNYENMFIQGNTN